MEGPVYPGDLITSIFTKNTTTGIWTDSVIIVRGSISKKAGLEPFQGSFTFDPADGFGTPPPPLYLTLFFLPPHFYFVPGWGEGCVLKCSELIKIGIHNEYTMALVDVEIHNSGPWNYGEVEFSNLIIESQTMGTEWCTK